MRTSGTPECWLITGLCQGCRCNDAHVSLESGARGRGSTQGLAYMKVLAALREVLCVVQEHHESTRVNGTLKAGAAQQARLERSMARVQQSASKVQLLQILLCDDAFSTLHRLKSMRYNDMLVVPFMVSFATPPL